MMSAFTFFQNGDIRTLLGYSEETDDECNIPKLCPSLLLGQKTYTDHHKQ